MSSPLTTTLARFLQNQWRTTPAIAGRLYDEPLDEKKLRAARQALSRLRESVVNGRWPIEVPAGKSLVLDERWERKGDGRGSEKHFRLRILDQSRNGEPRRGEGTAYLQIWAPPESWAGWIVPGFATLERDRSINHKHLYTDVRGPDNWLTVASSPVYREAERTSGKAVYDELYGPGGNGWAGNGDLVYVGMGTGSGLADLRVVRELLEENKARCVRAVPIDFSPVLLSETMANFYHSFGAEIDAGRLSVHPILGDVEQPEEWAPLLPAIEKGASLVIGMFGNTIGHLQYRERQTLLRGLDALDAWARRHGVPRWSTKNSRFFLGISLQRKEGAPHGREPGQAMRWLNLIADPLITLLETQEGEYRIFPLPREKWVTVEGRTPIAELRRRGPRDRGQVLGHFCHEELPYKPSDGLTGVVQRYFFAFERDLELEARQVFQRHHLPEARWGECGALKASFQGGVDQIVLCEVTQFNLLTFRPALRRLGVVHSENQVHMMKVGNTHPYAVLTFARA